MNKQEKLKKLLSGEKVDDISSLLRGDVLSEINFKDKEEKYLNNFLIRETLLSIHEDVLNPKHDRQTFGPGTFVGRQGQLNCIILTKNVLENKLKWSVADIVNKINYQALYSYKLRCTKSCFDHIYELVMQIYPDANLKPYYFKKASHVWYDEKGNLDNKLIKDAIREFVGILTNPRGRYRFKLKNIPQWINYKMFREPILPYDTNLSYMLSYCFGNSHIKAIMFAYPELNLKPYYFANVPNNYWSGEKGLEHAKEAMTELMDILTNPKGEYRLSKDEIVKIFKFKTYGKPLLPYRKNMRGMLQTLFKNSPSAPFKLLEDE